MDINLPINDPAVLAEVTAVFERYEDALVHNKVEVLDELFWNSPATNTVITTFGRDTATAMTEFFRDGSTRIGRQSQTWVRLPEGWRVVAAHASLLDG